MKKSISSTLLLAFAALLYGAPASDLYAQAAKAVAFPDKPVRLLIASAAGAGVESAGGSMDEFAKYLHAEISKWAKVIREAGIRAH